METKKIYLDCTHTYNSGLNTGIQRVVKNIVKNSIKISRELNLEIIPVILINKNYYTFDKFLNLNENIPLNISLKIFLKKFYKNLKGLLKIITFNKSDYLFESPKLTIFLNEITDNFLFRVDNQINKKIEFQENETLVLLDSFWYNNYQKLIILKAKKVRIVNITYDLIPILYPQFCDEHLSKAFKLWYENNSNYMDKFVCISNSVKEDTYNYIIKDIDKNVSKEKFDYFYLGADFEIIISTQIK